MHCGVLLTEGHYHGSNHDSCKFVACCNILNLLSGLKMQPGNHSQYFSGIMGNPLENPQNKIAAILTYYCGVTVLSNFCWKQVLQLSP